MKKLRIWLWIAIGAVLLALTGVWGFAWYYFIFQGKASGGGGIGVYEESPFSPEKNLSLFLEQNDFLINEPEEMNLTVLCGGEITGDISVTDENGNVVCQIENDGSGVLNASLRIEESKARAGGLTAKADGEESNTASFYVLPEITEEMFGRLGGVAEDLAEYISDEEFDDPYGQEAFEKITRHLEEDERVEAVAENNGVILFQTVDSLMGSYGMGRREGLDFGRGFSDADEIYQKWKDRQDVKEEVIESVIPITNNRIYHSAPHDTDWLVSETIPIFERQEERLAESMGMDQRGFAGSKAREMMKDGKFLDCGLWVFHTHGNQLERSDGSDMLFFSLGRVSEEVMLDLLDEDGRKTGYRYFWGEIQKDPDTGKITGAEHYRMVYDLVQAEEGSRADHLIWGSTRYLESIIRNRMFDNTVIYFVVCYGYSDPELRGLFFRHGASAFIGCRQALNGPLAAAVMEQLVEVMGKKDMKGQGGSLQTALESPLSQKADKAASDMLHDLVDTDEGYRENWEAYQDAVRDAPVVYSAAGGKSRRVFEGKTVLKGRVADPEDEGIGGAEVTLYRWLNHGFEKVKQTRTGSDGKYSVTVPAGVYGITAEKETGSHGVVLEGSATVQAGEEEETAPVIILGLAELMGTVKDEETGEPVEGASVQWQMDGTASSVFTDEDGAFTISNLVPGNYRLRVTKAGYQDKDGITVKVEMGATTVLLEDILLKKDVDFYRYLREVHIPDVGRASRQSLSVGNIANMECMGDLLAPAGGLGFLSADVRDYDGDGDREMIVIDAVRTLMGETDLGRLGYHRGDAPCFALDLQLYGAQDGQVQLLDSVYITEMEGASWGPMVFGVQKQDGRFYFYGYSSMTDYITYGSRPFTVYHVEDKQLVMDYIGGTIGWGQGSYQGDPNRALGTRNLALLDTPLEYVHNTLKGFEHNPDDALGRLEGSIFTGITMNCSGNSIVYQASDYTYIEEILQDGEAAVRDRRPEIPGEYQQPAQAAGAEAEADAIISSISSASGIGLTKEGKDVREDTLSITYRAPGGSTIRMMFDQATGRRKFVGVVSSGGSRTAEWTALKDACLSLPEFGLDPVVFAQYYGECSFNLGSREGNGATVMVGNAGSCVMNIQW